MDKIVSSWRIITVPLAVVLVILTVTSRADVLASASVDVAHHYALIREFIDFGSRTVWRPNLVEMNFYPALAHASAAQLGRHIGIMRGLAIICIFSALTVYFCFCLATIEDLSWRSVRSLLVLVGIIEVLANFQLVVGDEVIVTFFFPQLFGDALAIGFAFLIFENTSRNAIARMLLLAAASWIVGYAHLLPALWLLVSFLCLSFLDVGFALQRAGWRQWPQFGWRKYWQVLGYLALVVLFAAIHPSFNQMKKIAGNNGGIFFALQPKTIGLLVVSFGIVGLPIAVWSAFRFGERGRFERLMLGMTAASLILLGFQFAALRTLNLGSPYAVKKHLFLVFTCAAPVATLAISRFIDQALGVGTQRSTQSQDVRSDYMSRLAFAALGAVAAVNGFYPFKSTFDFGRLARLQAVAVSLPADKAVLPNDNCLSGSLNYLVYIGDRHSARDQTSSDIIDERVFEITARAAAHKIPLDFVITDQPARYYDVAASLPSTVFLTYSDAPPGYRQVDPRQFIPTVVPGEVVRIGGNALAAKYLGRGWSKIEDWGVWTDSATATLRFGLDRETTSDHLLRMSIHPFLAAEKSVRDVTILLNGALVDSLRLTSRTQISIPLPAATSRIVRVDFETKDLTSPRELGLSDDPRLLGVALESFAVVAQGKSDSLSSSQAKKSSTR
jgi:hypothetical protein